VIVKSLRNVTVALEVHVGDTELRDVRSISSNAAGNRAAREEPDFNGGVAPFHSINSTIDSIEIGSVCTF
jgi:hypothetical protein